MKLINWLRKVFCEKNSAYGTIKLADLKMTLLNTFSSEPPHEVSMYVPRVEIREKVQTILFTKSREVIYNSITIVDAPRHPISGEGSTKIIPSSSQPSSPTSPKNQPPGPPKPAVNIPQATIKAPTPTNPTNSTPATSPANSTSSTIPTKSTPSPNTGNSSNSATLPTTQRPESKHKSSKKKEKPA